MDSEGAITEEERDLMELDKVLHPPDTKYTIIDYLLNIKQYDRAYDILTYWNTMLSQLFVETERKKLTVIDRLLLSSDDERR